MPSSVAFLYSSSTTMKEIVLTASGPSSCVASAWILLSASLMRSSPVSRSRMVAMVTCVPSVSVPVIASMAARICGEWTTESIWAWSTDSNPSTCSDPSMNSDGAATGLSGTTRPDKAASWSMSPIRESICERPDGVIASPRKRSVTTLASPESPKSSSSSSRASATALSSGRVDAVSGIGARLVAPAASRTVMMMRTSMVT